MNPILKSKEIKVNNKPGIYKKLVWNDKNQTYEDFDGKMLVIN